MSTIPEKELGLMKDHGEAIPVFGRYMNDELGSFNDGAITDLRFRFVMTLLGAPSFKSVIDTQPAEAAVAHAFNISDAAFAEAEGRGWVRPISADADLSLVQDAQGRRMARFNVTNQMEGARELQRQQNVVAQPQLRGSSWPFPTN